jgi:H+/Cl- antiporter ClcA
MSALPLVSRFRRGRIAVSLARRRDYGMTLFVFLTAAIVTGAGCTFFMRAFERVLAHRLDLDNLGPWAFVVTPLGFLIAVQAIRRLAPAAEGSGIPQVIVAARHLGARRRPELQSLVAGSTLVLKALALLLALAVGASTGREGPTVHIAACLFVIVASLLARVCGVELDLRSAIVAGGAAGLAAAFNTPLAGVTFAIEELSGDHFHGIKDFVLMAIIVAALTAKSFTGEYVYFGRLADPAAVPMTVVVGIGIVAGAAGALFSTGVIVGQRWLARWRGGLRGAAITVVCSWGVLAVAALAGTEVLGPGNEPASRLVRGELAPWVLSFPLAKAAATLFTYWSGVAGGIFAPCLAIGAALGAEMSHLAGASSTSGATVGMAAFLAGTIQAPITSFVIIFEMTGHHSFLLPIMMGALLGMLTARGLGAAHLYQSLAEAYEQKKDQ